MEEKEINDTEISKFTDDVILYMKNSIPPKRTDNQIQ